MNIFLKATCLVLCCLFFSAPLLAAEKKSTFQSLNPLSNIDLPSLWNSKPKVKKKKRVRRKRSSQKGGRIVKIPLPHRRPTEGEDTATDQPLSKSIQSTITKKMVKEKSVKTGSLKQSEETSGRVIKTAMPLPPPLTKWSKKDVGLAQQYCKAVLANVDVSVKPIAPIRYNACGVPAPLKVSAVAEAQGKRVAVNPPATLNCKMTAKLAKWVEKKLQPLALKHFSSRVRMIHNIASYSCRNRYNNPSKKISEHAKANALDIAGFTLENGQSISVLKHWPQEALEKSEFLKDVHKSACSSFVVVLGPEANEAHKNHFHFDLGRYPVCE